MIGYFLRWIVCGVAGLYGFEGNLGFVICFLFRFSNYISDRD